MKSEHFFLPSNADRSQVLVRILHCLLVLPTDKGYDIEIKERSGKRSDAQNRYLWGAVYPAILQQGRDLLAGFTVEDLHDYCLGEHFGWETIAALGRRRQRPIRRSSKLSPAEFSDYVAFIQQRMSEHGIVVLDPDQSMVSNE